MTLLDAALAYAKRGWPVLPIYEPVGHSCACGYEECQHPAKHPRTPNGYLDATTEESKIRAWWKRWPRANVGVATGLSGLIVLDVDPRHGGDESMRAIIAEYGALDTLAALSGGGGEHYYLLASIATATRANALGSRYPGIDVRAQGGYIIAPPSKHISGRPYEWEASSPAEPCVVPRWLVRLLEERELKPIDGADNGGPILEGQRNAMLTRFAGRLRRYGSTAQTIEKALLAMNAWQCVPPLAEREVHAIAQSVGRYAVGTHDGESKSPFKLLSELDAAKFFANRYGDRVRFCDRAGGWLVWDGRRWKIDDDSAILRLAGTCTDVIADLAGDLTDLDERKKLLGFAITLRKRRGLENFTALAATLDGIAIGSPERFDANAWLLNVENGTVDLRTGELREHERSDLITKLVSIPYDAGAACPRWERFLEEIFSGDAETIDFVQRAVGYSLTGSTSEHAFLVLYGTGANGKSSLLITVGKILGDYGVSASSETFVNRQAGSATNDLARLRGMRFVSAIETSEGRALAESFVKAVTGGDRISARFLYAEFFDFEPAFKLWLGTNHKPVIRGGDEGIWRRVRLVPFGRRFEGGQCDPQLRSKLDAELPGILAWAVRGCLEWQRRGLSPSTSVAEATDVYRSEMDIFAGFIDERCELDDGASVAVGELYREYRSWAEANGEKPLSQRWLSQRLAERGFTGKRTKRQRLWIGLRIAVGDA